MRPLHLLCLFALATSGCGGAPDSFVEGERTDEMINGTPRTGQLPTEETLRDFATAKRPAVWKRAA